MGGGPPARAGGGHEREPPSGGGGGGDMRRGKLKGRGGDGLMGGRTDIILTYNFGPYIMLLYTFI